MLAALLNTVLAATKSVPGYPATNTGAYIVAAIGALAGLIAAFLTYRGQRKQKEIESSLGERQLLAEEWASLRQELRTQLNFYKEENAALKLQIASLETQIDGLTEELSQARTEISLLHQQLITRRRDFHGPDGTET